MKKKNLSPHTGKKRKRKKTKTSVRGSVPDHSVPHKGRPPSKPENTSLPPERFIVEKNLGVGGLCAVFHCTDALRTIWGDTQTSLAMKKLLPEYIGNPKANLLLMQEFCLTRQLAHPHIIRVHDIHHIPLHEPNAAIEPVTPFTSFDHPSPLQQLANTETKQSYELCMTMELLTGPSLADLIHENPQGMGKKILPLAKQLFSTIHYLHSRGIAHGDIKPANITVEPGGRLVLFDFNAAVGGLLPGFAEQAESQKLRADLRLKNFTPLYASPERIEKGLPSLEDDIFTAACTVFHLAYGTRPYVAENALVARQKSYPLQNPLFMLPRAIHKLLCRALVWDPAARPTSGYCLHILGGRALQRSLDTHHSPPLACFFSRPLFRSLARQGIRPSRLWRRLLWPTSNPHA